ncbi:MAG: LLM class flavin-dependent oxidoreductase [Rhodospirillales bacterium]|nr:LLM class flavin-dependent oxidoreductase [Rhodospirillales bacterium]
MKFGIFDYIDQRDEPLSKTYDDRLKLLAAAEAAGFYGYHLTEHHATPLSSTPSPAVYLAAAARETSRIRLGALLFLLPLYHPVRFAEEMLMLDNLSHGRLEIGVGRGIAPAEFDSLGIDFGVSQERFDEAFAILHQAFTQGRIDYRGKHFECIDVPVINRPVQQPHPPYWYGLRGEHGQKFAAAHGMNGVTLGPTARIAGILENYRKSWTENAAEREIFGSPVTEPLLGAMRAMFIADTDAEAESLARPAYAKWFESLNWLWLHRGLKIPIAISPSFDDARASGSLVVGSPDTVRGVLAEQAGIAPFNYLVLQLAFGSLTHEQEMHSLELFSSEVMPALAPLGS